MMGTQLPCQPDEDTFALGHLLLLVVSKSCFKSHNIVLNAVGGEKRHPAVWGCYFLACE